jgi:hypothetical protein
MKIDRYRIHDWFDVKTKLPYYGIQAKFDGKWMHCHEDGIPLLFNNEEKAERKLIELNDKLERGI